MTTSPEQVLGATLHAVENERISLKTVVAYLGGSREAILLLASDSKTVWLGLFFVLLAGFAREYDGEYLLAEPWHLLLPLAASLATSFLLFGLISLVGIRHGIQGSQFLKGYRSFLGLYWMTAPLAWFYAIPVERFCSEALAVELNLQLLGLVSLWRVILITRVISVLFDVRMLPVFPIVMLFADTVALILLSFVPFPLMAVMGGIRLTPAESVIANASLLANFAGMLSFPIWLGATLYASSCNNPPWSSSAAAIVRSRGIDRSLWVTFGLLAIGLGIVLPATQREQRLRYQAEALLRDGKLRQAVDLLNSHRRDEFPPHWDMPPRTYSGDTKPSIVELVGLVAESPDAWVRPILIDKFRRQLGGHHPYVNRLCQMPDDDRRKVLDVLDLLPEKNKILRGDDTYSGLEYSLRELAEWDDDTARSWHFPPISDDVRNKAKRSLHDLKETKSKAEK